MTLSARSAPEDDDVRLSRTARPGVLAVEQRSRRRYGRHTHDAFGIGVLLDGAQESASGRGPVRAERGQIITVNPGEVHDGVPVAGAPRRWRMLYLAPEALTPALAGIGASSGVELAHPVLDRPAAAQAFLALHAALTAPVLDPLAADGLLVETLSHLIDHTPPPAPAAPAAVTPARRLLDEDPAGETSLSDLAALCGLSRFHFLRAFRAATGLPPHAYRVQRRLHLARRLILRGDALADAAFASGFADQSHFNRHFVRAYGYTPGRLSKVAREG